MRNHAGPEAPQLLIIDDEALIRWALRQRLEQEGYTVHEAADGAAGLSRIASDGIVGVLLDLRLPDMDGIEVLRRLRADHPECRVWIMTAHETYRAREDAFDLGVEGFVVKPFDVEDLIVKLRSSLGQ